MDGTKTDGGPSNDGSRVNRPQGALGQIVNASQTSGETDVSEKRNSNEGYT